MVEKRQSMFSIREFLVSFAVSAQNPQIVNLAADFKSKAPLFMCKTCIQTVKDSAQNAPKVADWDTKSKTFSVEGHCPRPPLHPLPSSAPSPSAPRFAPPDQNFWIRPWLRAQKCRGTVKRTSQHLQRPTRPQINAQLISRSVHLGVQQLDFNRS